MHAPWHLHPSLKSRICGACPTCGQYIIVHNSGLSQGWELNFRAIPPRETSPNKTNKWVCFHFSVFSNFPNPRTPNPRPQSCFLVLNMPAQFCGVYGVRSEILCIKQVFIVSMFDLRIWTQFVPGFVKSAIPAFPSVSRHSLVFCKPRKPPYVTVIIMPYKIAKYKWSHLGPCPKSRCKENIDFDIICVSN